MTGVWLGMGRNRSPQTVLIEMTMVQSGSPLRILIIELPYDPATTREKLKYMST